jgi:hypothetical protein
MIEAATDEAGQPHSSKGLNVAGAIELMQAGSTKFGRIADVVKIGCGDQVTPFLPVEDQTDSTCTLADGSDVLPAVTEWREHPFGFRGSPSFERPVGSDARCMHPSLA